MGFHGVIIKEKSYDPRYFVEFSYESEMVDIEKGRAQVIRRQPSPEIIYDEDTEEKLKSVDRTKLELELINLVLDHFISKINLKDLLPRR